MRNIFLIALIVVAARSLDAQGPYDWVSASSPPTNAVMSPTRPYAVCRGREHNGPLFAGIYAGGGCSVNFSGSIVVATDSLAFLTLLSGAPQWVEGTGKRVPGSIGTMPSNTISAGVSYRGGPQMIICGFGGYAGYVYSDTCQVGATGMTMADTSTLLVGWMAADLPAYTWVESGSPPSNAVLADGGTRAVCRGTDTDGRLWAGYWNFDGATASCISAYGGGVERATRGITFLTLVGGATRWLNNPGKVVPGELGPIPVIAVDAGVNYSGYHMILCSQGGYVGWAYMDTCSVSGSPPPTGPATILVGRVR